MVKRTFAPRLITIHGTWDTADSEAGPLWWQRDGALHQRLRERKVWGDHSLSPDLVYPFIWDGANSEESRVAAARRLATYLFQHAQMFDLHVIAHSHGGNILRDALSELGGKLYESHRRGIRSITTVGTPFFVYRTAQNRLIVPVAIALSVLTIIMSGVIFGVGVLAINGSSATASELLTFLISLTFTALLMFLGGVLLMIPLFRMQSPKIDRSPPELFCEWACIHSKSDEAMIALGAVRESVRLGSRQRRSTSSSLIKQLNVLEISTGVLLVGGTIVLSAAVAFVPLTFVPMTADPTLLAVPVVFGAALAAVLVWRILFRDLIKQTVELAFALARSTGARFTDLLNHIANRQIAAAAFGDDCGAGIASVRVTPWENVGTPIICAGELHVSLEQQVVTSFSDTLGKVRATLSVDESKNFDVSAFRSLLTWNELAHTAYFKNDDFLGMICQRLADAQSRPQTSATQGPSD